MIFALLLSSADALVQLTVDPTRNILYSRSEKGTVRVFDLGADGSECTCVASMPVERIVELASMYSRYVLALIIILFPYPVPLFCTRGISATDFTFDTADTVLKFCEESTVPLAVSALHSQFLLHAPFGVCCCQFHCSPALSVLFSSDRELDKSIFKQLVRISPIESSESSTLHLMAISSCGEHCALDLPRCFEASNPLYVPLGLCVGV